MLWRHLRNRSLGGAKFRRQHRVGRFFVDFLCEAALLIVELDGGQHTIDVERDAERTRYLDAFGYRVIRFWNSEVEESLEGVLERIACELGNQRS